MEKIYPQNWMALDKPIREILAIDFSVTRSGITEIRDQTVITDGRTTEDLMCFSKQTMEEYVGVTETFGRLWELTVAKANNKLNPIVVINSNITLMPIEDNRKPISELIKPISETIPFCDQCISKGVRHLKECPKYVPIIR